MTIQTAWIIGYGSPLSIACSSHLERNFSLKKFGRREGCDYYLDLSDSSGLEDLFHGFFTQIGIPRAVIFTHRYRPIDDPLERNTLKELSQGIILELGPVLALARARERIDSTSAEMTCIYLSSTSGSRYQIDTPLYYSLMKAFMTGALPILSERFKRPMIYWNCLVLADFLKGDFAHSNERLDMLRQLGAMTPAETVPDINDLGALIASLVTPAFKHLSGQILFCDGGLSNVGIEAYLRKVRHGP